MKRSSNLKDTPPRRRANGAGSPVRVCSALRRTVLGPVLSIGLFLSGAVGASATSAQEADASPEEKTVQNCSDAEAPAVVRVLVLDLTASQPSVESIAAALGPVIAREAKLARGYEIITSGEIRSAMSQESAKQLAGCDDSSCLAEVAEALDADLLVSGRVDLTTTQPISDAETGEPLEVSAPLLSLSLLNTRAIVTVNRVSMAWPGDPALLPGVARAATQLLVFDKEERKPGQLIVDGAPSDAQVFVDDDEVSFSVATGEALPVEVGPHRVRVIAPGYITKTQFVLAQSGETARVDGSLEAEGLSAWWLWGGAVAALVAGVGATALLVTVTADAPVAVDQTLTLPTYGSLRGQQ